MTFLRKTFALDMGEINWKVMFREKKTRAKNYQIHL
jgi:hypothetical protein